MDSIWKNDYARLSAYIKDSPSIRISSNIITIPEEVRGEFYRLFDGIRTGFVQECFPELLARGNALSAAYTEASRLVLEKMGTASIEISLNVKWFLQNPADGLARVLFDPLFVVLKGDIDLAAFEKQAKKLVTDAFSKSFREGYLYWVELSLVAELGGDKSYRVPAVDELMDNLMGEGHENVGQHMSSIPEAIEIRNISFLQHPVVSFMTPRIFMHSTSLDKLVALHSDYVEPQWTANRVSENAEWYDFISLRNEHDVSRLRPDLKLPIELGKILPDIMLYTAECPEDIALVADHRRIMRPDLSVEVMETSDWFENGKLSSVKRHHAVMKPRFGTYIICREAPPQAAYDELAPKPATLQPAHPANQQTGEPMPSVSPEKTPQEPVAEPPPDIHIVNVGYDMNQMDVVVDALKSSIHTV